ncbi:MAG: hypothetical protein ACYC2O_09120, partial [Microthrixaceae bacterium]
IDLVAYAIANAPVAGASESPLISAFLEVLLGCGGREIAEHGPPSVHELVPTAFRAMVSCAEMLTVEQDSAVADLFEDAVRDRIDSAGDDAARVWKSHRALQQLGRAMAVLKLGDFAFYASDQLQNAFIGPLSWSVTGQGAAHDLGSWAAVCSDVTLDSNRLFRDLTLRPPFTDNRRELHDYPELTAFAVDAVKPLERCSQEYRGQLAEFLPGSWGDAEAAAMVAAVLLLGEIDGGTCPAMASGTWSGSWSSDRTASGATVQAEVVVTGTVLRGEVDVDSSTYAMGGPMVGAISCRTVAFGKVDNSIEFRGTLRGDGQQLVGTYAAWQRPGSASTPTDTGTFTATLEVPAIPRADGFGPEYLTRVLQHADPSTAGFRVAPPTAGADIHVWALRNAQDQVVGWALFAYTFTPAIHMDAEGLAGYELLAWYPSADAICERTTDAAAPGHFEVRQVLTC